MHGVAPTALGMSLRYPAFRAELKFSGRPSGPWRLGIRRAAPEVFLSRSLQTFRRRIAPPRKDLYLPTPDSAILRKTFVMLPAPSSER